MQSASRINPDYPGTIAACVVLSFLGYVDFLGMPILAGSLVDHAGYTEEQVGYLAAFDTGGLFFASVFTSILVTHYNRRVLTIVGIILAILGNLGSVFVDSINLLFALRFLSGAGGGVVYAVVVAILAASTQTARNYTYLIFCIAIGNALILYSFP